VGAGTVLSVPFAEAAYEAGAEFIVAPNTDPAVIAYTKSKGLLSVPGAYTPSEIVNAYALGADIVKIFPILPDGEGYLKNVISPLSHIPFMVTGGINPDTIEKFLAMGPVAVAAGATIATRELAEAEDYDTIRANAEKHTRRIR
jgi:2-dehydro-3-deoxyphosphogluconate aldolase/(4S)-4-hydroxy-2-oxoglutarate aldolase